MRITGLWSLCDDGLVRPVINGEVLAANNAWVDVPFLVDTGADATVFSADIRASLGLAPQQSTQGIGGVGGSASSEVLSAEIRLTTSDGRKIVIRGQFFAVMDPKSLEMSVLGRDITNLFALIVDRQQDVVCLLGQRHRYRIEES